MRYQVRRQRESGSGKRWGVYDTLPVPATLVEGGFFKASAALREAREYNRLDRETKADRLEGRDYSKDRLVTDGFDGVGDFLPW